MATVQVVGYGRVALKMLDSSTQSYTEYLGYSTRNLYNETSTAVTSSFLNGCTAVANLMEGSYVGNRISYDFEVVE